MDILNLIFKADTKDLDKANDGLSKLSGNIPGLQGRLKELKDTFEDADKAIKGLGIAAESVAGAVGILVGALGALGIAMAFEYNEKIEELGDLAHMYGYNASQIDLMKKAAEDAGGSIDIVMNTYARVAKNIGYGTTQTADALKQLGVSANDASGHLKSADSITAELVEKWETGKKTTADAAAMTLLLGKSWQQALPSIEAAAEANKYANEMMSKGIGISTLGSEAAEKDKEAHMKMSYIFDVIGSQLVSTVIPAFTSLVDWFVKSYETGGAVASMVTLLKGATEALMIVIRGAISIFVAFDTLLTSVGKSFGAIAAMIANPSQAFSIFKQWKADMVDLGTETSKTMAKIWGGAGNSFNTNAIDKASNPNYGNGGGDAHPMSSGKTHQQLTQEQQDNKTYYDELNKLLMDNAKIGASVADVINQQAEAFANAHPQANQYYKDLYKNWLEQNEAKKENQSLTDEIEKAQFDLNAQDKTAVEIIKMKIEQEKKLKPFADQKKFDTLEQTLIQSELNRESRAFKDTIDALAKSNQNHIKTILDTAASWGKSNTEIKNQNELYQVHIAYQNKIDELERQNKLTAEEKLRLTKEQIAAEQALQEAQSKRATEEGNWMNGVKKAYVDYQDSASKVADTVARHVTSVFDGLQSSVKQFILTGKFDFKSFLSNVLAEMADFLAQQMVSNFMKVIVGGAGGSSGGSGFLSTAFSFIKGMFADGGVFNQGHLQAFATGGVVTSPTLFPMSNGTGMMGEAGPEAVMPLTRMSNGQLGIQSMGSSSNQTINNININVSGSNNPDETATKVRQETMRAMSQIADQRIANSRRSGGLLQPVGAQAF